MSIYDNRLTSAYRESGGRSFPLIARWWTSLHDEVLERLIRQYQWLWYWKASREIQQITEPSVLDAWKIEHQKVPQNIWFNAIMYHAQFRAAEVGLTRLIRRPLRRVCPLCNQEFVEDSLPASLADRLGMDGLDFCAPCLTRAFFQPGTDTATRSEILSYLRELAEMLQAIPSQRFADNISTLHPLSQRIAFIKLLTRGPTVCAVKREFGSWFDGLREAGLLEQDARRLVIGTQCRAIDGHFCLSLGEKTIDDFLHAHGIPHEKEPRYPEGNYRADFRIGAAFVEYFGLAGDPQYDKKTKLKQEIASRHGITLVEIYPKDLASLNSLEKKLLRLAETSART